ncbi:MAG: bacterioferritin-associated ferredoxin [Pseudomonadota bacterium]
MYVCLCKAVTDSHIREAVNQGCCSMRELRNELGVATQCGRCAVTAREVLDEALTEQALRIPGAA